MTDKSKPALWHHVSNPEAARQMNNPKIFQMLSPFLNQENTVGEAAKRLGITNVKMFRQVKIFLELELLEIAKLENRAGKAIKHYRTVAPGFFVPHALLNSETIEIEFLAQNTFWEQRLARAVGALNHDAMQNAGSYFFRGENGDLRKVTGRSEGFNLPENLSPSLNQSPVWSDWSVVMLEPETAQALYQDMAALFKRYKSLHQVNSGRAYLMRTAMAALCEEDAKMMTG